MSELAVLEELQYTTTMSVILKTKVGEMKSEAIVGLVAIEAIVIE
jgi:hypothetical protein